MSHSRTDGSGLADRSFAAKRGAWWWGLPLGRRALIERAVAVADLPEEAARTVRCVVGGAKLWPRESVEVADELISHFHEGLDCGETVESLIEKFGEPLQAARLIRKAKRRQRPAVWRALYMVFVVVLVACGLTAALYLSRASSLYMARPVASVPSSDFNAAVQRVKSVWALPEAEQEEIAEFTRRTSWEGRLAGANGNTDDFFRHLDAIFARREQLYSEQTVSSDLRAAIMDEEAALLLHKGLKSGWVSPVDPRLLEVGDRIREPIRLEGVREAFRELVDRMYTDDGTGDGHLTGEGIELVRQLKQWHDPSLKDRFMEPVWYAFPARRSEVSARFAAIVSRVENPYGAINGESVEAVVESFRHSVQECLRYPALSVVLPPLVEVLMATEEAARARQIAMRALLTLPKS